MNDVSTLRLYALRATYLLIVVGLGMDIWPGIIHPPRDLEHMRSVVRAILAGVTLMAALGIRYPIRMLPLLLLELTWKTIWVVAFGLPLWLDNRLTPETRDTWNACLMGLVLFPLVIPWGYVFRNYVSAASDRWRPTGRLATAQAEPRTY